MKLFDVYPVYDIEIARAEGSTLWTPEGKQYLDMYGGHAVISIGHSNPRYVAAISDQVTKIGFYSNSVKIPAQQRLAELLGKLSKKSDYQLFLCNSGAEANENAMKLASFHTGRKLVVAFGKSFHGRTSLAVAATSNPSIVAPVNETENVVFLPFNDVTALKELFAKRGGEVAAVIFEAIQGVGGVQVATDEFLKTIRALCDDHGALMIADEVQCGCGRSGKYFATDWAGIDADIYSMAKGLGNGFPIGAILISPKIAPRHGMLGTTFGGNQLAVAAATAVAEEMLEKNLVERAGALGEKIMSSLRTMPAITEVRGRGLMIGIELADDSAPLRKALLFDKGIFVGSASDKRVVRLLPSLAVPEEACDRTLEALRELLSAK